MSNKEYSRSNTHQAHRHTCSVSYEAGSQLKNTSTEAHYYHPTPAPETVVIQSKPKKSKDACCWGW
ncbi:hypothetical protein BDB01DRAFT_199402 [Pilobolus umbonatus]|nr:hypothetical protein BDB01DRAFT_199402 [Pilobolus umbonatus]